MISNFISTIDKTDRGGTWLSYDGELWPARDLIWVIYAPCGCLQGGLCAETDSRLLNTAEQARVCHHDGVVPLIERDRVLGYDYRLLHKSTYEHVAGANGTPPACLHHPHLGIPIIHPPAGYWWATSDQLFGRRTYRRHLVLIGDIDSRYTTPVTRRALCETPATAGQRWHGGSSLLQTVPCRQCEISAQQLEPEVITR